MVPFNLMQKHFLLLFQWYHAHRGRITYLEEKNSTLLCSRKTTRVKQWPDFTWRSGRPSSRSLCKSPSHRVSGARFCCWFIFLSSDCSAYFRNSLSTQSWKQRHGKSLSAVPCHFVRSSPGRPMWNWTGSRCAGREGGLLGRGAGREDGSHERRNGVGLEREEEGGLRGQTEQNVPGNGRSVSWVYLGAEELHLMDGRGWRSSSRG